MNIYLAGPITGEGYEGVMRRINALKLLLENRGYTVLHPMLGKDYLRTETEFRPQGYEHPVSQDHSIFERDQWMVTQQVDVMLANLEEATRVSIGTCFELAWASLTGVHTIVVMRDGNIHQHCFVTEAADIVFENIPDALDYLGALTQ